MANRVLLGAIGGSYKFMVSKPGFDVTAGLPNEQLAFSTDWPDAGKVLMTGSISMGSGGVLQMPIPFFTQYLTVIAMINVGGVFYPMSTFGSNINGNASIGLRGDLQSVAFNMNGTGPGDIIYYAIMENQFGI